MPSWPHAPTHQLGRAGAYMITGSTLRKEPLFKSATRLTFLCEQLVDLASHHGWKLEAWAVFPNHYHFVASVQEKAETLPRFIGHFHAVTAKTINDEDKTPGRKVWFQ
jgi:putative transposase